MGKQPLFTNPVIQSPWTSSAPKTIAVKNKVKIQKDNEDNNIHKYLDRYSSLFSINFPYQKLGFQAHSGSYYAFYKLAKYELKESSGSLFKIQLIPTAISSQDIQRQIQPRFEYKLQQKLQGKMIPSSTKAPLSMNSSVEVIDITDDGVATNVGENVIKYGRSAGRKQKSPKMYVKIAPKATILAKSELEKFMK
nr:uncharacterized protein LOC111416098 isoform X2 [Onthophagus taurus]